MRAGGISIVLRLLVSGRRLGQHIVRVGRCLLERRVVASHKASAAIFSHRGLITLGAGGFGLKTDPPDAAS